MGHYIQSVYIIYIYSTLYLLYTYIYIYYTDIIICSIHFYIGFNVYVHSSKG